jgi:hypothetical protein
MLQTKQGLATFWGRLIENAKNETKKENPL